MLKNKVLIIVIALVILLGAGGYAYISTTKSKTPQGTSENTKTSEMMDTKASDESSITGTVLDLIRSGKNMKCTFSYDDDDAGSTQGTTYVSGQKMRGDYAVVTSKNETIESHMISDGTWMYTWGSALPQGMKMKMDTFSADETSAQDAQAVNQNIKELQNKVDYKCQGWSVDNSKFELPSEIEFTDYSEFLDKLKSSMPAKGNCSACDMIEDESAKTQCQKALGC